MSEQNVGIRQIFLDTETTGREHKAGHRVIEIGCVEVIDRQPTTRTFQCYLNPVGAIMDPGAQAIHGLSMEFLSDKPQFSQKVQEFIDFIQGAEVLIHNAPFDEGFLNAELARVGRPAIWSIASKITDTYIMAQSLYPKQHNGLDKLCDRLEIDRQHRTHHGALLDAQLLCDAYLKMTKDQSPYIDDAEIGRQPRPPIHYLTERKSGIIVATRPDDLLAHEKYLDDLEAINKKTSVWRSNALKGAPKA